VTTAVHLSRAARDQLDQAQRLAGLHVMSWATGRCAACAEPVPCLTAVGALFTVARYGALPRRVPAATHPDLAARQPPRALMGPAGPLQRLR
jgi:hypothetical protein